MLNFVLLHRYGTHLMPNHRLRGSRIPIPMRLRLINDTPHLLLLLLTQIHISRSKVLDQTVRLRRAGDSNHALGRDPRKRDLCDGAPFAFSEVLNLLHDCEVIVEVLALEFGDWTSGQYTCPYPPGRLWSRGKRAWVCRLT